MHVVFDIGLMHDLANTPQHGIEQVVAAQNRLECHVVAVMAQVTANQVKPSGIDWLATYLGRCPVHLARLSIDLVLSILFAAYGDLTWVAGLFLGISAAVIAVVASAVLRIGKRVIKNPAMFFIAAAAFVGIFFFELPFPLIVAVAIVIGLVGGQARPDWFNLIQGHDEAAVTDGADVLVGDAYVALGRPSWGRSARVLTSGLALWFGPVLVLLLVAGQGSVFVDVAWFFSSAAVLTFGGAYSVSAYISQESVSTFGWLEPGEIISGLGMAETTPAPSFKSFSSSGFWGHATPVS